MDLIIKSFLYILPAYIANSSAALFGGGFPLDFKKKFLDKRRIFGDGKTFQGFFLGILFGTIAGNIEGFFLLNTEYSFGSLSFCTMLGFLLAFGALTGDLSASFIKRRLKMEKGQKAPVLDQLDFVIGAVLFSSLIYSISLEMFLFLIIMTPVIHFLLNFIGYKLKCKTVPW